MTTIKDIERVKVLTFPQDVFARKIMIGDVQIKLVDNGATAHYWLLDNDNKIIFDGGVIELTNTELSNWTTSDEQLVDAVITKLGLTKAQ